MASEASDFGSAADLLGTPQHRQSSSRGTRPTRPETVSANPPDQSATISRQANRHRLSRTARHLLRRSCSRKRRDCATHTRFLSTLPKAPDAEGTSSTYRQVVTTYDHGRFHLQWSPLLAGERRSRRTQGLDQKLEASPRASRPAAARKAAAHTP